MAGGVNIKMGVSGVAQFKQSINQSKQSLKTLDEQLKLTEKQYKASGDAEEYMRQKTEQLEGKLYLQKQVVADAQKALQDMSDRGVDKSSKAFQEMLRTLTQAKGDMIDTETQMRNIEQAGDDAASGVDSMNTQLANVGKGISYQNVTEGIQNITGKLEAAGKAAFNMGQRLVQATLGKGQWADQLRTDAKVMGLTDDELQRMQKTSMLIDTSVEAIVSSQKKLKKGLGSADKGTMGAILELMGEGYDPRGKDWEDVFWDTGEALMNFTDETEKEVYAQKLFGRSWNELIPLFDAGRKEYEETNAGWHTMSEEQLDDLTKMDDQYQKLSIAWDDFKTELLTTFSPALTSAMEKITGVVEELNKYLETPEGKEMLAQMSETITTLINDLLNINPEDVVNGLKSVIDGITDAFKWIQKHHGEVVTALEAIVAGWAALKITGGALEVLKVVNAISGLTGATAGATAAGTAAGSSWGAGFAAAVAKAAPWLIGVYTLLNPADTEDALGNNDLLDENGELTAEARAYGFEKDENGELVQNPAEKGLDLTPAAMGLDLTPAGRKYSAQQEAAIQELWDKYRTGQLTQADMTGMSNLILNDAKFNELMNNLYEITQNTPTWKDLTDLPEDFFLDRSGGSDTGNSEMTEAAKGMQGLPDKTAAAVNRALNGAYVKVDGAGLSAVIGQYFAQWVASQA